MNSTRLSFCTSLWHYRLFRGPPDPWENGMLINRTAKNLIFKMILAPPEEKNLNFNRHIGDRNGFRAIFLFFFISWITEFSIRNCTFSDSHALALSSLGYVYLYVMYIFLFDISNLLLLTPFITIAVNDWTIEFQEFRVFNSASYSVFFFF